MRRRHPLLTKFTTRKTVEILFINSDDTLREEFNEFFDEIKANHYYTNTTEDSISVLNEQKIDTVILKISRLSDLSILKYIHDYYNKIKVLISAREDFEEALTIFNQVHFEKVKSPIGLSELKGHLID